MTGLCMLAGDWCGDLPPSGLSAEVKVDGWRALWLRDINGKAGLWTRGGIPIEGTAHIRWRLEQLEAAAGEPLFLDGEFQVGESLEATKRWCEQGWKLGGEAGTLHLFDAMPLEAWRAGGTDAPHYARKARLAELCATLSADAWDWRPGSRGHDPPDCVRLVTDTWLFDAGDVLAEANRTWASGGEGLMLKDPCRGYRRKRSDAWLKVKQDNRHHWQARAA